MVVPWRGPEITHKINKWTHNNFESQWQNKSIAIKWWNNQKMTTNVNDSLQFSVAVKMYISAWIGFYQLSF